MPVARHRGCPTRRATKSGGVSRPDKHRAGSTTSPNQLSNLSIPRSKATVTAAVRSSTPSLP